MNRRSYAGGTPPRQAPFTDACNAYAIEWKDVFLEGNDIGAWLVANLNKIVVILFVCLLPTCPHDGEGNGEG